MLIPRFTITALTALLVVSAAQAYEVVAHNSSELNGYINAAAPGATILMAPGVYTGSVYASPHGMADQPITIKAQDPKNPPVFDSQGIGGGLLMLDGGENYILDGLIIRSGPVSTSNGIQLAFGRNIVIRNVKSYDATGANGNAIKFTGCNNFLMYNCTASNYGGCGVDAVGCAEGLIMNSRFDNGSRYAGCGVQAKGGSFNIGYYDNVFINGGSRTIHMGGSTGTSYFHQGNYSYGYEAYDQVAMGNKFYDCYNPVCFTAATDCEFQYNTSQDPYCFVARTHWEGMGATSNINFAHNLTVYGNLYRVFEDDSFYHGGVWPYTKPSTYTYQANYWYNSLNPSASLPTPFTPDPAAAGGQNPQLDASLVPQLDEAKSYGADSPGKEAAWAQYVSRFQWAWEVAQSYEPQAVISGSGSAAPGGAIALDAAASLGGISSYGQNPIRSYEWDLNGDSIFDISSATALMAVTYDCLTMQYGLGQGLHPLTLRIVVENELGEIVSDTASGQFEIVPEPLSLCLLIAGFSAMCLRRN